MTTAGLRGVGNRFAAAENSGNSPANNLPTVNGYVGSRLLVAVDLQSV